MLNFLFNYTVHTSNGPFLFNWIEYHALINIFLALFNTRQLRAKDSRRNHFRSQKWSNFHKTDNYRRRNMTLWIWYRNNTNNRLSSALKTRHIQKKPLSSLDKAYENLWIRFLICKMCVANGWKWFKNFFSRSSTDKR